MFFYRNFPWLLKLILIYDYFLLTLVSFNFCSTFARGIRIDPILSPCLTDFSNNLLYWRFLYFGGILNESRLIIHIMVSDKSLTKRDWLIFSALINKRLSDSLGNSVLIICLHNIFKFKLNCKYLEM